MNFTKGEYGPTLVNDFALGFIKRHKAEPFFLYYPMILTHDPFQPTPDSAEWDPRALAEKVNNDKKHFADKPRETNHEILPYRRQPFRPGQTDATNHGPSNSIDLQMNTRRLCIFTMMVVNAAAQVARSEDRVSTDVFRRIDDIQYAQVEGRSLLLIHGDQDPQVPINPSHELHAKYKELKLSVHFEVVHGGAHGGDGFFDPQRNELVREFFTKHQIDPQQTK